MANRIYDGPMSEKSTHNSTCNIPVCITGKIMDVEMLDESMILNEEQIQLIIQNGFNPSNTENMFADIPDDVDTKIGILFTLGKTMDAWRLMRENIETINFALIASNPYFELDREATDVYKSLYDRGQLDDDSYAYFNVVSGKFFDYDFFLKYISDCKTASEILEKLHGAFNGISPYDVGMIEMSDDIRSIIFDTISDGEDLTTYVFGGKIAVEFTSQDIFQLIKNHNIRSDAHRMAFETIYKRGTVIPEEDILEEMFNYIHSEEYDYDYLTFTDLEYMEAYLKYLGEHAEYFIANHEKVYKNILLSEAFLNYPNLVGNYILGNLSDLVDDDIVPEFTDLNITNIALMLPAERSMYLYVYMQNKFFPWVNFDDAFIMSPAYPQMGVHLVYNKYTKSVFAGIVINGYLRYKIYTIEEFVETHDFDWAYAPTIDTENLNDEIFSTCNSTNDYLECMLVTSRVRDEIIDSYHGGDDPCHGCTMTCGACCSDEGCDNCEIHNCCDGECDECDCTDCQNTPDFDEECESDHGSSYEIIQEENNF